MFKRLFAKLKGIVVAFLKMSLKQSEIVLMNLLYAIFAKGMFFFAFYIIFLFDSNATDTKNISGLVLSGVAVVFWVLISNTLRDYKMQYITPYKGALVRGMFDVRYLLLVGIIFYYFNLVYSPKEFYIYILVMIVSLVIARLCEARKISILRKDWLVYESTRK